MNTLLMPRQNKTDLVTVRLMRRNYRELATAEEADEYFSLTPESVLRLSYNAGRGNHDSASGRATGAL